MEKRINKKGFTLVELLAVIVILSLIVSIASISITRTKKYANEKEKVALKQTILSAFENYRIDNFVAKSDEVPISNFKFASKLSFNNKECKYGNSTIRYVIKKDKLAAISSVKDITAEEVAALNRKLANSEEEVFCLQLSCNGTLIIDDKNNFETNEVLSYSGNDILETQDEINAATKAGLTVITKQFKVNYCQ